MDPPRVTAIEESNLLIKFTKELTEAVKNDKECAIT